MKLKRLSYLLAALLLVIGIMFTSGCSDDELHTANALIGLASDLMAEKPEGIGAQDETEQVPTSVAAQDSTAAEDPGAQAPTTIEPETEEEPSRPVDEQIPEDGEYLSMEQVAAYLHLYGHLPGNYLTKNEAKELGWVPSENNLWEVAPGCAIGGDRFGNREKLLPEKKGRKYYECDVNYDGNDRDAERLVYSNDGLIYYTDNHYEDFMLLFDGS